MGSLFGIFHLNHQPVVTVELEAMKATLQHRTQQSFHTCIDQAVGLGCEPQDTPKLTQTPIQLAADTRIDNRSELVQKLALPTEAGDADILIQAYQKWGTDCPKYLTGLFAFALYDPTCQALFCARDPFGVRPFYYAYEPGKFFAFASEMQALLALPAVPHQLNELKVASYFEPEYDRTSDTFYQGIKRLKPAHTFWVTNASAQEKQYWSPYHIPQQTPASIQEGTDRFLYYFKQAVKRNMNEAEPMGVALSGGLDSSSVACTASQYFASQPLHCFSAVYHRSHRSDERSYIQCVLNQEQHRLIPHFIYPEEHSPLENLDTLWEEQEEPFSLPNLYVLRNIARSAQHAGITSILTGIDGDTVVSHGTEYLIELAQQGQWTAFAEQAHALAHFKEKPPLRYFLKFGVPVLQAQLAKGHWYAFIRSVRHSSRLFSLPLHKVWWLCLKAALKLKFGQTSILSKRSRHQLKRQGRLHPSLHQLHTLHDIEAETIASGRYGHVFEVLDKLGAHNRVTFTFPFFDKDLVTYCLSLPPQYKLHQGWTRVILHRAMEHILPAKVQQRHSKANLSQGFCWSLMRFERQRFAEFISQKAIALKPYTRFKKLANCFHYHPTVLRPQFAYTLWQSIVLHSWLCQNKFIHT